MPGKEDMAKSIKKALKRLRIGSQNAEIYPEDEGPKVYKTDFGSNSTFVTFWHLIRAMLGPTILAIPSGFKLGGLAFAPCGFFLLLFLVTYNMRRLILNAAHLSEREGVSVRTYDQVAYTAFNSCTEKTKKYARGFKNMINVLFIITHLDACVIFMIFMSKNIEAIIVHYAPHTFLVERYFIFFQVIFIMSLCTVRELKHMTPFSMIAALLLLLSIVIMISCFFVSPLGKFKDCDMVGNGKTLSHFICVVLFCLSGISIALTMKSSMRHPEQFMSCPGIFYISVVIIGVVFTTFGFLGYLKYNAATKPSVLLNVPPGSILADFLKTITIASVLLTTPLAFYVAFNVLWTNYLKELFSPVNVLFSEYFIRFCMITFCFIVAIAYPELGRMIVLKGALFHTHLEVTIPTILDYITNYPEHGTGKYHYRLLRTIFIAFLGISFCIGGIILAIIDWAVAP